MHVVTNYQPSIDFYWLHLLTLYLELLTVIASFLYKTATIYTKVWWLQSHECRCVVCLQQAKNEYLLVRNKLEALFNVSL